MTSFRYSAQGFGSCNVVGDGKRAQYTDSFDKAGREPSAEDWANFWSLVETLDAWNWRGDYGAGVRCGTPWTLELELGPRVMTCAGNCFDDDSAPPGFKRLYDAMMSLAGNVEGNRKKITHELQVLQRIRYILHEYMDSSSSELIYQIQRTAWIGRHSGQLIGREPIVADVPGGIRITMRSGDEYDLTLTPVESEDTQ